MLDNISKLEGTRRVAIRTRLGLLVGTLAVS